MSTESRRDPPPGALADPPVCKCGHREKAHAPEVVTDGRCASFGCDCTSWEPVKPEGGFVAVPPIAEYALLKELVMLLAKNHRYTAYQTWEERGGRDYRALKGLCEALGNEWWWPGE